MCRHPMPPATPHQPEFPSDIEWTSRSYIKMDKNSNFQLKLSIQTVLPSGWQALPSGWKALPSGWRVLPSGWQALPSGWKALPSGWKALPSGWKAVTLDN
tara:strand:- start:594 stop:893 length:300 start_codon:yes stop_codon:yes gene_type:complete